jgi:CopG-like RHH_1 or ribbon-helix-helix domain, RHH_5
MKNSVAEKRTQVYFPEKLYREVRKRAKAESKSVAAVVREAVERYLKDKEVDWESDPFLKAAGFFKSDSGDLSLNHDHYLYGAKKKPAPKR